ncbi:MAG: GAF domain-containing protein [Spirochaetia bacterium]|nr:GAF domain-containing protein [Spirochaetia bacterium]
MKAAPLTKPALPAETSGRLPSEEDLIRAGAILARERNFRNLVTVFVEQAQDIARADLAAFYLAQDPGDRKSGLRLFFRRGGPEIPDTLPETGELVRFLRECRETTIFNNRDGGGDGAAKKPLFLREVLLHPTMRSGMALPLATPSGEIGVLFVCSKTPGFFNRSRFYFLDSYAKLASGAIQNSRLFDEMRESIRKIEALERYQENVFNSMTNMIITTDAQGFIHYFNDAAARAMGLGEAEIGRSLEEALRGSLSPKTLRTIAQSLQAGTEIIGLEGICRAARAELDFSLNITPLCTPRGRKEGLTLLFTNQTRENELKSRVRAVSEERRVIKDMFCRYMSQDLVSNLMEHPEEINLGGDKKTATVFFADIRGYTSFSEKREPGEIFKILNEYFSEAVEHVLRHRGYIDKFIGDCIMAVWGVPLSGDGDGARNAVSCALAIQGMVRSAKRNFFRNDASGLRVGIGINTGPLAAGNLGSLQRMEYSVIGDTVNLAARLEGVAEADEIIISQATRDCLGDGFRLEKRPEVRVKGKEKPIQIYNVLGLK